jgi:Septum formation
MASRIRLTGAALVGVLAAVLLPGCSASSPHATGTTPSTTPRSQASTSPSDEHGAKPLPPVPSVGTCRTLAYSDISRFSNDSPTSSCRKPLPHDIAFDGVQIGNDSVQNYAAAACQKSFAHYIGGDPAAQALSRLTVTYFVPSQADFDRGARWVRCDVIALQTANVLAPLPRAVHGVLSNPDALTRFGVCSQGEPGSANVHLVMCQQAHAFRAVEALRLGDPNARYPAESVVRSGGEQRCKAYLDQLLGPHGYTYAWTYPSPRDWRAGQRFGYCWHKTTS